MFGAPGSSDMVNRCQKIISPGAFFLHRPRIGAEPTAKSPTILHFYFQHESLIQHQEPALSENEKILHLVGLVNS